MTNFLGKEKFSALPSENTAPKLQFIEKNVNKKKLRFDKFDFWKKILENWKESMWTLWPLEKNSDREVFTSFFIMSGLALLTGNYTDSEDEDQNIKDSGYFLWDWPIISSIKPEFTFDCHWIYACCTSNCFCDNLTHTTKLLQKQFDVQKA